MGGMRGWALHSHPVCKVRPSIQRLKIGVGVFHPIAPDVIAQLLFDFVCDSGTNHSSSTQ